MYLSKPCSVFPKDYAQINTDYALLGISKLQGSIYHNFFHLNKIPVAKGAASQQLLKDVIGKILFQTQVKKSSIHYVIYSHTSLSKAPVGVNILANAVRFHQLTNALCFSFNLNKCASGIEALSRIEHLLAVSSDKAMTILLVTGDHHFNVQQRVLQNASICGDGFSAVLIKREPSKNHRLELIKTRKNVYPEYCQGAWLNRELANCLEQDFHKMMSKTLCDLGIKAKVYLQAIAYILPHNVNIPIWKKICDELQFNWDKVYVDNIPRYGHCSTADFLINIESIYDRLKSEDMIAIAGVGFGLSFVAALLKKH